MGEVLSSDHQVHELYSQNQDEKSCISADPSCRTDASLSFSTAAGPSDSDTQITINTARLARVEVLESENQHLNMKLQMLSFSSYFILLAFFEFLGPSVHELNYWGSKGGEQKRNRPTKLNTLNQLFTFDETETQLSSAGPCISLYDFKITSVQVCNNMDLFSLPAYEGGRVDAISRTGYWYIAMLFQR